MSLPLPLTLSPSKVNTFKDCALAFRFSAIDRLPSPPSAPAVTGTLVHRALEKLFWDVPAGSRSPAAGQACLDEAWAETVKGGEWLGLDLDAAGSAAMLADARRLVERYFTMEDPDRVRAIGTELWVEARLGTLSLRGIIDRLDLDDQGRLVVVDYKTGRVPGVPSEQARLAGVHFYSFLCEQVLGVRPVKVQLLYLREAVTISTEPSEQSTRGMITRTRAIWTAVERACEREDFRPRPSALCAWCSFQAWCPAFGGDPSLAKAEAGLKVQAGLGAEVGLAVPA